MTSTAPESHEAVGARARAAVARYRAARAVAPAEAHAQAVADMGPMVAPCDPAPHPPTCGATSAPAPPDVPGCRHEVPASLYMTWDEAQAVESRREPWAAIGARLAASPVVSRVDVPRARVAPAPPVVPDLAAGAPEAERGRRRGRVAVLLAEAARLLEGEPIEVVARAKRALDRGA